VRPDTAVTVVNVQWFGSGVLQPRSPLDCLAALAQAVRRSGEDRQRRELAALLAAIFTPTAMSGRVGETPAPSLLGRG
jgi:hypothetical protein